MNAACRILLLAVAIGGCHGTVTGGPDAPGRDDGVFGDERLDQWLPPGPSSVEVELDGSESRGFAVLLRTAGATDRIIIEPSIAVRSWDWDIEIPGSCVGQPLQSFYKFAYAAGFYFIRKLARRLPSCDLVDRFVDRVAILLNQIATAIPPASERPLKHCLLAGVVDGGAGAAATVFEDCSEECFASGQSVGEDRAGVFCEAAEAAGAAPDPGPHARGAVNSCGLSYQIACDAAYLGTTTTGTCGPFSNGNNAEPWDNSRSLDCDYTERPFDVHP